MKALRRALAAGLLCAALLPAAHAGRPCEASAQDVSSVTRAMALAEATARRLDASGAEVVLLARAGQDLSKYQLQWSHLGFAYREGPPTAAGLPGVWRVLHKLNQCGTAEAAVYRQGLAEFFLDRPARYEAAFSVLAPSLQAGLGPVLRDNQRAVLFHSPRYNMLAYPWSQAYQQSNQFVIETLAGVLAPSADSRRAAQEVLRARGYEPSVLQLGALTRLGARATAANIAFDDHPNSERFADRIATVTADSVFAWLQRSRLGGAPVFVD